MLLIAILSPLLRTSDCSSPPLLPFCSTLSQIFCGTKGNISVPKKEHGSKMCLPNFQV